MVSRLPKSGFTLAIVTLISSLLFPLISCREKQELPKVLLITGGKKYERTAFLEMFNSFEGFSYEEVIHPEANQSYVTSAIDKYDVIVYYDFVQQIDTLQKQAFLSMLYGGKNLLFLHHSIVCYQDWPEFEKIVGGRYYHETPSGPPPSSYRHDVDIPVRIADQSHPVTKGLEDFVIRDEVYNHYSISPDVQPLLETNHPENERYLGWTHTYESSRIVYLQLGHDHHAYEDRNFRQLVNQAIIWLAKNP